MIALWHSGDEDGLQSQRSRVQIKNWGGGAVGLGMGMGLGGSIGLGKRIGIGLVMSVLIFLGNTPLKKKEKKSPSYKKTN